MSASLPLPAPAATVRGWQGQRAGAYVDGLLSDTRRKNGWQLAETRRHALRLSAPAGTRGLIG